ncbi:MAG: phosphoribosylglycinamide formyltransferase-1 [Gammaproteobacteria bacterium]|jgi:phosphoribosylglycinamide formyltransferase-1
MNIAFLASHRGSNMQSIIDACKSGLLSATPVVVISNNIDSGALARAKREGIPACHLSSQSFPDEAELDQMIVNSLLQYNTELVVLAGYMKRIGPLVLAAFPGRVINIHPCLLPKYGGQGMYGMRVHEAVIAAGDKESGVTIHVVNDEYDKGAILAQRKVSVEEGDSAESLAQRVLALEHTLYVDTIRNIIAGKVLLP